MDGNTLNIANSKAQLRKGVLELCILAIIHEQPIYPSDIIKRLKESQLIVVEGTLYPLLNRLKDAGYLEYNWQESDQDHRENITKSLNMENSSTWSCMIPGMI